jgi:hypothetical protein
MVATPTIARQLAEAVIRGIQTPEKMRKYVLHVEDYRGHWLIWQGLPQRAPNPDGSLTVSAGGGGLSMRVDKCTGEISDVHYSR